MLRQSLRRLGVNAEEALAAAGMAPTRRAEELSIAEFCALARAVSAARAGG
jgi:16S rRNA (adenine1518-N6/adenine1519-N6)-dimethyltransferase